MEEANAALRQRFSGPIDDLPSTATTAHAKAQDLVYRAFEARGRRRIQLARKALELSLDRRDAAIEHYRELIRLDPDDHQGVRYALLTALLLAGRDEDASTLIEQFGDEPTALWRYGRALAVFRSEGDSRAARERLRAALRTNRHVPRFLTDEADWPGLEPTAYAPGSREEAVICDSDLGEAWRATPDAIRWLRAQAPARRSGKRHRR